jgi:hypothetical protein
MSASIQYLEAWTVEDLVDPRGSRVVHIEAEPKDVDAWPIRWKHRRIGLFSNKKPNADAMLSEVQRGLQALAPDLVFTYGSKEPLAQEAEKGVIDSLSTCDVVILASAECGGCTSWLCRDHITLEKRGIPCLTLATHRFEAMARAVLARGGVTNPHLAIPRHPVSGITFEQVQGRIHDIMGRISLEILGSDVVAHKTSEHTT